MSVVRITEAATTFVSTIQLGLFASATRDMYYRDSSAMVRRGQGGCRGGRASHIPFAIH